MTPQEYENRRQASSAVARKIPAYVSDADIAAAAASGDVAAWLRERRPEWTDEQVSTIAAAARG